MTSKIILPLLSLLLVLSSTTVQSGEKPIARLTTDLGEITLELYDQKAPITVANFVRYSQEGFYDGTIFHRVIPGFVVQGGGYTFDHVKKETHEPIKNESENGLKNEKWTISMARLPHPDSATSQFFINVNTNKSLNPKKDVPGYTVFANVIEGRSVVRAITKEPIGRIRKDAPDTPVRILSIKLELPESYKIPSNLQPIQEN